MNFSSERLQQLRQALVETAFSSYNLQSRMHRLHTLDTSKVHVYIKRDDELSCAISGSKIRKYATLIPYLTSNKVQQVAVIGGAFSNNIVGISQLLLENRIQPTLFLRKPGNNKVHGNLFLTKLLVDEKNIHWIDRQDWPHVEERALAYVQQKNQEGILSQLIPEGAFLFSAFLGALSLSWDIIRNEQSENITFDHIFVDAGTGLQAIALILAHSWSFHQAKIHCVLLAVNQQEFEQKLEALSQEFSKFMGEEVLPPTNYEVHIPKVAASFGSVSKKTLKFIANFAREEGVLLDPVYSGKLIYESQKIISENCIRGNVLLIHSGGTMSLLGFNELFKI
ncbi:MAG: 1-aminocyclopropane-1-carboxylate deaminase [Chlamydiota bacterium]|nr:1-aminocyclopropane-1-carboxylate deaminase [Chlamydiota bacterium]